MLIFVKRNKDGQWSEQFEVSEQAWVQILAVAKNQIAILHFSDYVDIIVCCRG